MPRGFHTGLELMPTVRLLMLGMALLMSGSQLSAREDHATIRSAELPAQARETLALIRQGGPFPFSRDGAIFANREGRLPRAARGTYREYTVVTPGSRDRGARRIIAAGTGRFWYSDDHYRSFRRIIE